MTERSTRRARLKCTEAEEANWSLKMILKAGVGTNTVEEYSQSRASKGRWEYRGEERRKQFVKEEMESIIAESDIKVRGLKLIRKNLSNDLRSQISHNMFRRKMAKILDQCKIRSQERRTAASERMVWLLKKYGGVRDDFVVTVEVSEYGDCKLFKKNPVCEREESSGQ